LSTVYYSFDVSDTLIKKNISSQEISFAKRTLFNRNVKDTDGDVTVDLSNVGTAKGVYVKTDIEISLKVNGNIIPVTSFLFMTISALTTLAVACSDTNGASVEIVVWGS
jgi:hypothetical protein